MLSKRPFIPLCIAFGSGLLCAGHLSGSWLLSVALMLAAVLTLQIMKRRRKPSVREPDHSLLPIPKLPGYIDGELLLLLLSFIFFLAAVFSQYAHQNRREVARKQLASASQVAVKILQTPEAFVEPGEGRWKTAGEIIAVDGKQVTPIRIQVSGWGGVFGRGELIAGTIRYRPPTPPLYPGAFSFERYLEGNGQASAVWIDGEIFHSQHPSLLRRLDNFRTEAIRRMREVLPAEEGAFLVAVLFGYRGGLDAETRGCFQRSGMGHLLAISGLHVGLMLSISWLLLAIFIADRRTRALVCIAICLVYLGLSGARIPAMRASIVAIIYLAGHILSRRADIINSLALAALILMVENPGVVYDLGFQLSFTAVLFICCIGSAVKNYLPAVSDGEGLSIRRRMLYYLVGLITVSLSAWLAIFPLVACTFQHISIVGVVMNMIAIPLMTVVLGCGVLMECMILTGITGWVISIAAEPCRLLISFVNWSGSLPWGNYDVSPPPMWAVILYYGLFCLWFLRDTVPVGRLRRIGVRVLVLSICAATINLSLFLFPAASKNPGTFWLLPGKGGELVVYESRDGCSVFAPVKFRKQHLEAFLRWRRCRQVVDLCIIGNDKSLEGLQAMRVVRIRRKKAGIDTALNNLIPEKVERFDFGSGEIEIRRNASGKVKDWMVTGGDTRISRKGMITVRRESVSLEQISRSETGVIRIDSVLGVSGYTRNGWAMITSMPCSVDK